MIIEHNKKSYTINELVFMKNPHSPYLGTLYGYDDKTFNTIEEVINYIDKTEFKQEFDNKFEQFLK